MEFTERFSDPSSEEFKKLANELEDFLDDIFKSAISGFLYVKVVSFEKGSIVCDFLIYTELESSAKADDFNKVMSAAIERGEAKNFTITDFAIGKDVVAAVKGTKERKNEFPLKVFAAASFGALVALVIGFVLYKKVSRTRREREGFKNTKDIIPLNDFISPNEEEEDGELASQKIRISNYEDKEEDEDEVTPFCKPGVKKMSLV